MSDSEAASQAGHEVGGPLIWTGVVAIIVSCAIPLANGLLTGWHPARAGLYAGLAFASLLLFAQPSIPLLARLITCQPWLYISGSAVLGLGLLALSGDPYIQPAVLCVPLVTIALGGSARQTVAVGMLLLALIPAGLLWSGAPLSVILPSLGSYTALMLLIGMVVRVAVRLAAQRQATARMASDLARQRDELARLYEQAALTATLSERNRLARELHDTIAQELTAVLMQLEAAQRGFERDPQRARSRVARAHELAHDALDHVRRSVWTLAEPLVGPGELTDALAAAAQRFGASSGIQAVYHHHGPAPSVSAAAAAQVVRIAQEGLQNVEKHAAATAVRVDSYAGEEGLRLVVHDNGRGFAAEQLALPSQGGFGLISMQERARLAGGVLTVESAPGAGTTLMLTIAAECEVGE
jgi:signal transduction histidine kinase